MNRLRHWWRSHARDPVFWTDVIQAAKTAAAAVIAWVLATHVFDLPQSFLAPWAALLVVHATVYRTFSRGVRQIGATFAGVVLAWAVGNALGLDATAVAVVLLLALAVGAIRWFGEESSTLAATALVVLTTGFTDEDSMLVSRLADTAIGVGVGLLVNLVVWPPLRRRTAVSAIDAVDDRMGELLVDIADGLDRGVTREDADAWLDRIERIEEELDHAWALVRQARESARMNPRRSAGELRDPKQWISLLERMDQALAETRSMVRTVVIGLEGASWQQGFRAGYVEVVRATGRAIADADPAPLQECRRRLEALVEGVEQEDDPPRLWPVYGALVVNLRNIVDAMVEVAKVNPLRQPPMPFTRREVR